jgi:hypothetical protein
MVWFVLAGMAACVVVAAVWPLFRASAAANDRFGDHDTPQSINAMDLKDVLGQIEPYGRDR